jgi:arginine exporter protein ArgO
MDFEEFWQDAVFTVGLVLLGIIFFPILAFGDAQYSPLNKPR